VDACVRRAIPSSALTRRPRLTAAFAIPSTRQRHPGDGSSRRHWFPRHACSRHYADTAARRALLFRASILRGRSGQGRLALPCRSRGSAAASRPCRAHASVALGLAEFRGVASDHKIALIASSQPPPSAIRRPRRWSVWRVAANVARMPARIPRRTRRRTTVRHLIGCPRRPAKALVVSGTTIRLFRGRRRIV